MKSVGVHENNALHGMLNDILAGGKSIVPAM